MRTVKPKVIETIKIKNLKTLEIEERQIIEKRHHKTYGTWYRDINKIWIHQSRVIH